MSVWRPNLYFRGSLRVSSEITKAKIATWQQPHLNVNAVLRTFAILMKS